MPMCSSSPTLASGGQALCTFAVDGMQPELWDPVRGTMRNLTDFRQDDGETTVPLEFAPAQSWFVVFRNKAVQPKELRANFPELKSAAEIAGPWEVRFDPKWGGPEAATFDQLDDWTKRPERGIRYYSGTATYRKTFDASSRVVSRSRPGEVHRPRPPQRARPGRGLDRAVGRVGAARSVARARQRARNRGRQRLGQPADRRRAGTAGLRMAAGAHGTWRLFEAVPGLVREEPASSVEGPLLLHDLELLHQRLAAHLIGPARAGSPYVRGLDAPRQRACRETG